MNIISAKNISCGYERERLVLKNISLDIKENEFLGIIGPNGCGKSTLLKALSGVLPPLDGAVQFSKENIYKLPLQQIAQQIAFLSSEIPIAFPFSVLEIVLMGRIPHMKRMQGYSKEDLKVVEEALSLTDCLNLRKRSIDDLSAGERQRVFITKLLAQEPCIVFLDEPTTHLDIRHKIEILNLLKKLNQEKKLTVVIVLHDLNLASEYCNRLILLDNGEIEKDARPEEVLTYKMIEKVYKTLVVVNKNPISGKPHILLVSERRKDRD